jgi:intracellular septation protein
MGYNLFMKLLFDFLPIALFFGCFKFYGVYVATIVMLIASLLQTMIFWLKHRRIEITHGVNLVIVLILGSATILLKNEMFIKWKPTAVYWIFAALFLGSQLIGKKSFLERLMNSKITLPKKVWQRLNVSWVIFFVLMGALNLYVAYSYNMDTWVNFKLFGTLGATIVFVILQSIYMGKYLKDPETK